MSLPTLGDFAVFSASLPPPTTRSVPIRGPSGVWVVRYEEVSIEPVEIGGVSATDISRIGEVFDRSAAIQTMPSSEHWLTTAHGGGWIFPRPIQPRTRAHINKYNRHKQRPNGRPRHR